jgi:hypothetical protein
MVTYDLHHYLVTMHHQIYFKHSLVWYLLLSVCSLLLSSVNVQAANMINYKATSHGKQKLIIKK